MSHITMAASARAFGELFNAVRNNFHFSKSDSGEFGSFSAGYSVALHLENGVITLNDDNTVIVKDVHVVWDTLKVDVCFNLPGLPCIPGFCLVPDPWNGCLVGIPEICPPSRVCAKPIDLSGIVSEISHVQARLLAIYFTDPARIASESDLDAEIAGHPNKWKIFLDPTSVLVNPIDIPASIDKIF